MLGGTVRVLSRLPDSAEWWPYKMSMWSNHLNQDHVHEVEGWEPDGKVEAPGQGALSCPQLHLLLGDISHKVLCQPLYDQINPVVQSPYLACQVDRWSRLSSVIAN